MNRILSVAFAFSAAACSYIPNLSPHRIEIQQGNFVSQEMVGQLKTGMTKDQVRFAMGTPLVADVFHGDRWDYVFVRQRANSREVEHRRISVYFEQDKLARIEGDVVGASPTPATATPATPAAAGGGGGKP
jgi:outer membrane protein assembly factor BamE